MAHRNPTLDQVLPYVPGPTSESVAERFGLSVDQVVKLSSNEAPLGPAAGVRTALREASESANIHRYPSPQPARLRAAVAESLGVGTPNVVLTAGASVLWQMAIHAFSAEGDDVVIVEPSISSYRQAATLLGRNTATVAISYPFDVTASTIAAHVTSRTRIALLSSPNNTTSRLIESDEIAQLARTFPEVVFVIDEHYIHAAEHYLERSAINIVGQHPNLVVARSFSKMYGLASLRVGAAVGEPDVIDAFREFGAAWPISLPAELACLAAIAEVEHLEANIEMTRRGRGSLVEALSQLEVELVDEPDGGFLLFRPLQVSARQLHDDLLARGIVVRNDLDPAYIRVSVGTESENRAFIKAVEEVLHND